MSAACHFQELSRFVIQRVLVPIAATIGIVGNVVSIIVLTRPRMNSSTNTYLTALCISDIFILICSFVLSLKFYPSVREANSVFYWEVYRWGLWLHDSFLGISVWLTVWFTSERYIAVCHPLRGRVLCTISRARRAVAIIYLLVPPTIITTLFEFTVGTAYDPVSNTTVIRLSETSLAQDQVYRDIFYWYSASVFVLIPLIILATLNTLLIRAVKRSRQQRHSLTQMSAQYGSYHQRNENNITMTLVSLVFLFIICQIPSAVMLIVSKSDIPQNRCIVVGINNICNFLTMFNAASNFVLYSVKSDRYRRTFMLTFFPSAASRLLDINAINSNASFRMSSMRMSTRSNMRRISQDFRVH